MCRNRLILLFFGFLLIASSSFAQAKKYQVNASLGIGVYSEYQTEVETVGLVTGSPGFSFRVMWKPEYLLSAGFEIGSYPLYNIEEERVLTSFGITNFENSLHAITYSVAFSMNIIDKLEINSLIGLTRMTSIINSFDNEVSSGIWSTSFGGGVSYDIKISERFAIRTDAKWILITKFRETLFSLEIGVKYLLFEY
jgi:hypothetical protein